MKNSKKHTKNLELVQLSLLAAVMVVLQLFVTMLVRVGAVAPTLALIPLVIASAALGIKGGAILGALFGFIAFICGLTGLDAFTNMMIMYKPAETLLVCLSKAILAGIFSAIVYKLIMAATKKKLFPSVLAASIIAPVTNTALYVLGMALFFREMVPGHSFTDTDGLGVIIAAVFMIIITNFILEVIVTAICTPIVATILTKSKDYKKLLLK